MGKSLSQNDQKDVMKVIQQISIIDERLPRLHGEIDLEELEQWHKQIANAC